MSLPATEKARLCACGSGIQICIREDFGVYGTELLSSYHVRCADYSAKATEEKAKREKLVLALCEFRNAYTNLADLWNDGELMDIMNEASDKVGTDFSFFTASFDELGIDDWAWDMATAVNGSEDHL